MRKKTVGILFVLVLVVSLVLVIMPLASVLPRHLKHGRRLGNRAWRGSVYP